MGLVWMSWATPHVPERLALLHSREGLFQGFFCSTITKFLVKKNTESSQKALTHTVTCLAQLDETAALKRGDREARIVSYSYYSLSKKY